MRRGSPPHTRVLQLTAADAAQGAWIADCRRMDISSLNVESLLQHLRTQFRGAPPEGSIVGRTALRDEVAAHLGCSQLEAEQIVDSLILRGWLVLVRPPDSREVWEIT